MQIDEIIYLQKTILKQKITVKRLLSNSDTLDISYSSVHLRTLFFFFFSVQRELWTKIFPLLVFLFASVSDSV